MTPALEALLNETSQALADVVDVLKARGQDDAVAQALTDIASALEKHSSAKPVDMEPIAAAIRALKAPVVNVKFEPKVRAWEVVLHKTKTTPERRMTITPLNGEDHG